MKYINRFQDFSINENKQDLSKFKCIDGGPNNNDGGVQIDSLIVSVNGDDQFFEVATTIGGDIYVEYQGGDGEEFRNHFELEDGTRLQDSELKEFLSQNSPDCVGDSTEIDGFEIEIIDFSHEGGLEFGYLDIEVNGDTFQLEIKQDVTGMDLDSQVTYSSDEDGEIGRKHGLDLESDEAQGYFFDQYDKISMNNR